MPELPHGWRMRNSEGEVAGPPPEDDAFDSDDDSEHGQLHEPLNIRPDSEGWEDLEDDTEALNIKCLLCAENFPDAKNMIEHCETSHEFDFLGIQRQHKLDFYATIKLVNYIRSNVQAGQKVPDVKDPALWLDDKFLQPALEDDALLFTIDDIIDAPGTQEDESQTSG